MSTDDLGKLILRLTLGGLMLLHGLNKLQHGISGISSGVVAHGLPAAVAYGVYLGEVVAPVLILLGAFTRIAAAVFAFNMVVAVAMAHTGDLFHLGHGGGYALELQALYFFGAVTLALIGGGRFSIRP